MGQRAHPRQSSSRAERVIRGHTLLALPGTHHARLRGMSKVAVVASLIVAAVAVVACSSDPTSNDTSPSGSAATSKGCVDFVVTDAEKSCTVSTDCRFVDSTHLCPGDPPCGAQIPTNRAGRDRFDRETGGIARSPGSCGKSAPEACVAGRCVVCSGSQDCPDGG